MSFPRVVIFLVVSLGFGSCTSTPIHYHTLTPPAPVSAASDEAKCCQVTLARVRVPTAADRVELVLRNGNDEAVVLNNDFWLAPLRDEITMALTNNMARDFATAQTSSVNSKRYKLVVDITRFESFPGQFVVVTADWHAQRDGRPAVSSAQNCEAHSQVAVKTSVSSTVRGYQRALEEIAGQIVAALVEDRQSVAHPCMSE